MLSENSVFAIAGPNALVIDTKTCEMPFVLPRLALLGDAAEI